MKTLLFQTRRSSKPGDRRRPNSWTPAELGSFGQITSFGESGLTDRKIHRHRWEHLLADASRLKPKQLVKCAVVLVVIHRCVALEALKRTRRVVECRPNLGCLTIT